MNFMKSVFYALIACVGFQSFQMFGMMSLFKNKPSDNAQSVFKAHNDYATNKNIARIAKEYQLSSEQVKKLEDTKAKIKIDHSALVIPQFNNNEVCVTSTENDLVRHTVDIVASQARYNRLRQFVIDECNNHNHDMKSDMWIRERYRGSLSKTRY